MSSYIMSQPQNQQPQLPYPPFPGSQSTGSPFLSPFHSYPHHHHHHHLPHAPPPPPPSSSPFLHSYHSTAWDSIPGPDPLAIMLLTQRTGLSLQSPSPQSFLQQSFHRSPESGDESTGSRSAPLFYPFPTSSRVSHPISMLPPPPHHFLLHSSSQHLRHYDLPPNLKSDSIAAQSPVTGPMSPLFYDLSAPHHSARATPSCGPCAEEQVSSPTITDHVIAEAKRDKVTSLPTTNQLTTCTSSSTPSPPPKEQKVSVMTSIENRVVPDATPNGLQSGSHNEDSDNQNRKDGKSVSVTRDENEERLRDCEGEEEQETTASSLVQQHDSHPSSLKLLKDFKLPAKHTESKRLSQDPGPETRTIEVQCDGPDWTPVVLKSQIKSRVTSGDQTQSTGSECKKRKRKDQNAESGVKKSRDSSSGKKMGTKEKRDKLSEKKEMLAVARVGTSPAASITSSDCSKRLQAEQSQVQAESSCSARHDHHHQQHESPAKGAASPPISRSLSLRKQDTDPDHRLSSHPATTHVLPAKSLVSGATDMPCPKATPKKVSPGDEEYQQQFVRQSVFAITFARRA